MPCYGPRRPWGTQGRPTRDFPQTRTMPSMDPEMTRTPNLIWLPNARGEATTMCRKAVLTVGRRSASQWAWAVEVDGHCVSEGVSPTPDHARDAAVNAALEAAEGV